MNKQLLAVGNYGDSVKIFEYEDGKLKLVNEEGGIEKPSYLAIDKTGCFLFAVSETETDGSIYSYAIDRENKSLTYLDKQSTFGGSPCHIAVSNDNKRVLASNYGSGTVSSYLLEQDGKLIFVELIENQGELLSKSSRQKSPHAHGAFFYDNGFFSVDLGLDCALFYEFDGHEKATYRPRQSLFTNIGNGPRHMVIADGYAYVLGELGNEITVFELGNNDISPKVVTVISTLPKDFDGKSYASAISLSSDKKMLYCTNRGHDSVASFNISQGRIEFCGTLKTMGLFPRDFLMLEDENIFIFANQNSDELTLIKNSINNGHAHIFQYKTPSPSCVILI